MKEVTDKNFEEIVLQNEKPVVLDMWAPWCGPCRIVGPILEELSNETSNAEFVKCNVDENPKVSMRFGIRSIPTILFFKGGQLVDMQVGAVGKLQFKKKVDILIK
jgi:thioredoxin 1